MWITSSLDTVRIPTRIALGNFDGVHQGHRCVIEPVLSSTLPQQIASELLDISSSDSTQKACSTVVTFCPHPQEFFTGQRRKLLTPLDEKVLYLREMGVEQLVLLPFDHALSQMTASDFVETVLIHHLKPQHISVGQDFRFGCDRSGTAEQLQAISTTHHIATHIVPLHTFNGDRISSSAIRQALQAGELAQANDLLGRPYRLMGEVVQGQQLGRVLGFPTANLAVPSEKFLPCHGVYCVWVTGIATLPRQRVAGVMNIGNRPTVNGVQQTIEVHLLDWSGNLYGQTLTISLEKFIRPEQKFDSLDALKAQITADCDLARSLLASYPAL